MKVKTVVTLGYMVIVAVTMPSQGQSLSQDPPSPAWLEMHRGFAGEGMITPEWKRAISVWHSKETLDSLASHQKALTAGELAWMELIERRIPAWSTMIDSLRLPFDDTSLPDTVAILLGNQGGNDAFVLAPSTICFDLSRLDLLYGEASSDQNARRIDRFFAHEFTHILHKVWAREQNLQLQTPLDLALWECLTEGLGNYRSLSDKWIRSSGELTSQAQHVLSRLQPIFVERLSRLERATNEEASPLLEGLSMGPFDQKWGALTVALWLAQESKGDDRNLRLWVDLGPQGVLELARKYLPGELQRMLPSPGAKGRSDIVR